MKDIGNYSKEKKKNEKKIFKFLKYFSLFQACLVTLVFIIFNNVIIEGEKFVLTLSSKIIFLCILWGSWFLLAFLCDKCIKNKKK